MWVMWVQVCVTARVRKKVESWERVCTCVFASVCFRLVAVLAVVIDAAVSVVFASRERGEQQSVMRVWVDECMDV